jgi:hypothetical protein
MNWLTLFYHATIICAFAAATVALFSPNWVDTLDIDFPNDQRRWDTVGLLLYCRYDTLPFANGAVLVKKDRICDIYGSGDEAGFPSEEWRNAAIIFGVGTLTLLIALLLSCFCSMQQNLVRLLGVLTLTAFTLLLSGVLLWADELIALDSLPTKTAAMCPGADHFDRGACDLNYGSILAFVATALCIVALIPCAITECTYYTPPIPGLRQPKAPPTADNFCDQQLPVLRLDNDVEDGKVLVFQICTVQLTSLRRQDIV